MRVSYGPYPDQVADVTLPGSPTPAPMVLLIHGGFWRAAYDRHHLEAVADALADQGYVVVNTEYRRVGAGGGWPTTFQDVAQAVSSLPRIVRLAAPGRVEPGGVVLLGHSAGGHLALWAGVRARHGGDALAAVPAGTSAEGADDAVSTEPSEPTSDGAVGAPDLDSPLSGVRGVLALAPVCDLRATHRAGASENAVAALLGGAPESVPDRYAATDPALLGAPSVPTVVLHGRRDTLVPLAATQEWCAATSTPLEVLPEAGHFELIDPRSTAWPRVIASLSSLTSP